MKKTIRRTIIFASFAIVDLLMIYGTIVSFANTMGDKDITYAVKKVEEDYYEGKYQDMIDMMDLYDMYSSDFDKYHEAADAYNCKYLYDLYKDSGKQEKAEAYYEQLEGMLQNCQFDENIAIISVFLE